MNKIRAFYKLDLSYGYLIQEWKDKEGKLLPSPIWSFEYDNGGVAYLPYRRELLDDFIFKLEWPEDKDVSRN